MSDAKESDSIVFGRSYAWNFFLLHETERMQMFNYWLVATAFLAAAWVQAIGNSLHGVGICLAAVGLVSSLAFWRLDVRTRSLCLLAEDALRTFEADLAVELGQESIRLVHLSQTARTSRFDSYRVIIQSLQVFAAAAFLVAGAYSLFS